jgi:3',5'-cyclic AMP phosphodiesterase CpdA
MINTCIESDSPSADAWRDIVPDIRIGEHACRMQSPAPSPSPQSPAIRLAHVSDPHLSSLSHVRFGQLMNKRLLGYLSWRIRRQREHRPEVLQCLGLDLADVAPDHILITGDLTHVGLPSECREGATWLRDLGSPQEVTLVPGNHDSYVAAPWAETVGLWQPYMQGDVPQQSADRFPFLRRRGPVAVIGLSTAVPTAPFFATGSLGSAQLDALARMLETLRTEGLFRVVLLHHPPVHAVTSFRRRLIDAEAFGGVIRMHGAELVLHGHAHRWVRSAIDVDGRDVPVFGIPSGSALSHDLSRRAGYGLIDVARNAHGWEVHLRRRRLNAAGNAFENCGEESFRAPASA